MLSSATTAASTAQKASSSEKRSLQLLAKKYHNKKTNQDDDKHLINNTSTSSRFMTPVTKYEFKYRKSIFATIFAISNLSSVLFLILYLRCYSSYIQVANKKEDFEVKFRCCKNCPENSYCSNEQSDSMYACVCRRGYYSAQTQQTITKCTNISYSLEFPSKVLMKMDHITMPTDHMSLCTWFKISQNATTRHHLLNTLISSKQFHIAVNNTTIQLQLLHQTSHISCNLNAMQWYHLCVDIPFKKTTVQVFLNGQLYHILDMGALNSLGMSDSFEIGANINNTFENSFHGEISQLYLSNQSLSEDVSSFFISRPLRIDGIIISWLDVLQKAKEINAEWRDFLL